MKTQNYKIEQITINYDKKRKALSAKQRAGIQGNYRYYGAQSVIDYVNDYLFDGEYLLIAEDGENLKSNKKNIAQIVEGQFWLNNHAHIVQTNDKCNIRYLGYWLNATDISGYITGSAQPKLSQGNLNAIEIELPERNIQDKIVDILYTLDQKIKMNEAINRNLLNQGRALYEDLVSKYEINAKLGDLIASIETGKRPKGGAQDSGVPSIGAEKIECFGIYDYSGEKYIDEEFYSKLNRGHVLSGDVLLYKDGAYTGKSSMALDGFPHEKCVINEHVYKLNTLDNSFQFYLYFTLDSDKIKDYIYTLASSKAAQPGLNQSELQSVDIVLPQETDLVDFENKVSEMMRLIASNAKVNRGLSILRDTLLPKLMSGELDVSDLDI